MNAMLQDMRYALRQFRREPAFAATVVFTLALGIGANSTILSWITATLLNPIPGVSGTARMLTIQRGERSEHASPPLSYLDYVDLRERTRALSGMLAYHDDFVSITGDAQPQRIYGALASANYFEVLGVRPILGRSLIDTAASESAMAPEAVLSYQLWQDRFGGEEDVLGRSIEINLHPYTIVGVAPRRFVGCKSGLRTDIWLPLGADSQVWGSHRIQDRSTSWLNILAVLRPGVTARQAASELNAEMQRIVRATPTAHLGNNAISTDPLWRSPFGANVYLAGTLPMLLALAVVLLLLACANVANLLLVRSVSRRREFAIRLSVGAGRGTLVRQLMMENGLLALAGGALALLSTVWTARLITAFLPGTTLPLAIRGELDARVMVVTIFLSLLTAALSGLVPAWRACHMAPAAVLKDEALTAGAGLHKSRLASGLVVAQVALSLLILACAGLFIRSLQMARKADPGFDPSHVLLATFDLDPLGRSDEAGRALEQQAIERVRQIPGVQGVTLADFSPLNFTIHSEGVLPEGYVPRPHEDIEADRGEVGPDYLRVLRTTLIAGRDFTSEDTPATERVAIVNQAFASRYWPGQSVIGKRIFAAGRWRKVVGVAGNGKYRRLTREAAPLILMPLSQRYQGEVILHVRATGDPQAMGRTVERTLHSLNPNLPVYNVTTLRESMESGSVFERLAVTFGGAFGLLALFLAAIGLYGVVAYAANQRTHEIGIRMALGATRRVVFRQVLGHGFALTVAGLAAGLSLALYLTRFLRSMLYVVNSSDWFTFAVVVVILCGVSLLACLLPARRAASLDPMKALRTE